MISTSVAAMLRRQGLAIEGGVWDQAVTVGAPADDPRRLPGPRVLASIKYSPWRNFYRGREGADYRAHVHMQYAEFINAVVLASHDDDTFLEVGCGLGTITHILANKYRPRGTFLCLDLCQQMEKAARASLGGRARVFHGDMRESGWLKANVIHGHGVLEHLDDQGIYETLEQHRKSGARVAIHYVPGELHRKGSFGDERLMPLTWWTREWNVDESFTFNGGKDYVLIWRF